MEFGKKTTMKDKVAKATARGYDTGKPSTGSKPAPKVKVKPAGSLKKPGVKAIWKF